MGDLSKIFQAHIQSTNWTLIVLWAFWLIPAIFTIGVANDCSKSGDIVLSWITICGYFLTLFSFCHAFYLLTDSDFNPSRKDEASVVSPQ